MNHELSQVLDKQTHFRIWLQEFKDLKVGKLSDDLSITFIQCSILEEKDHDFLEDVVEKMKIEIKEFLSIYTISKNIKLNLSPYVILFLIILSNNIGTLIMYLYYIKGTITNEDLFTLKDLAFLFPTGFPLKDELQRCWDFQKRDGLNLLDQLEF
jgi:hypothetical protein